MEVTRVANSVSDAGLKLNDITSRQASALQQTSSVVEQTNAMVNKNSENATNAPVKFLLKAKAQSKKEQKLLLTSSGQLNELRKVMKKLSIKSKKVTKRLERLWL